MPDSTGDHPQSAVCTDEICWILPLTLSSACILPAPKRGQPQLKYTQNSSKSEESSDNGWMLLVRGLVIHIRISIALVLERLWSQGVRARRGCFGPCVSWSPPFGPTWDLRDRRKCWTPDVLSPFDLKSFSSLPASRCITKKWNSWIISCLYWWRYLA